MDKEEERAPILASCANLKSARPAGVESKLRVLIIELPHLFIANLHQSAIADARPMRCVYQSTGPLFSRTMECDGVLVLAFALLG